MIGLKSCNFEEPTVAQRAALDELCAEHGGELKISYVRTQMVLYLYARGADGSLTVLDEDGEVV